MNIRYWILLGIALLSAGVASCQVKEQELQEVTVADSGVAVGDLGVARFQINDLKNRGVIVRLRTDKDRIAAYRKEGYKKVADKIEERNKATNLLMEYAFVTKWSFCPVYFMESQHTALLMRSDTLIVKTADLLRDTAIYMNHDSFYLLDYGDLMDNAPRERTKNPNAESEQATTKAGAGYLVLKNHNQEQLRAPMPYEAKVWFEDFSNSDKVTPIDMPDARTDSVRSYLAQGTGKAAINKYMDEVYDHITETKQAPANAGSGSKPESAATGVTAGNPFQKSVKRLNDRFIDYFCKRLKKDKNLIFNDNEIYWWHKNPNISYLLHLRELEVRLKQSLDKDKDSQFIKQR